MRCVYWVLISLISLALRGQAEERRAADDPASRPAPWRPSPPPQPDAEGYVHIRGGSFLMGGDYDGEKPVHLVSTSGFRLMDHEVTNAEYFRFVRATRHRSPAHWKEDWFWMAEFGDHPVVHIAWEDAEAYCRWKGGRLPTEAEWEYACRGGLTQAKYPWGDEEPDESRANFDNVHATPYRTRPVRSYPPNAYGLYDMAGNVYEWVQDWYDRDYYAVSPSKDPQGPETGAIHVRRGGQWRSPPSSLRCARRYGGDPSARDDGSEAYFGFRCAKQGIEK